MMDKRTIRQQQIIDAAERIFLAKGFADAKMAEISQEANLSKGLTYHYFQSKEDLYLAVTYRALTFLLQQYQQTIQACQQENGYTTVAELFNTYFRFTREHRHYSELLMNYLSLTRGARGINPLSEGIQQSPHFQMLQEIHHRPMEIVVEQIRRGQEDGSILNQRHPHLLYLSAWALVVGFNELSLGTNQDEEDFIFQTSLKDWRTFTRQLIHNILLDPKLQPSE